MRGGNTAVKKRRKHLVESGTRHMEDGLAMLHNQKESRASSRTFCCWMSPSPDCEEHKLANDNHIEVVPSEVVNASPPPSTTSTPCTGKNTAPNC
ncbi:hypothetical protein OSTOST_20869 [Ostertagia ostertagi]